MNERPLLWDGVFFDGLSAWRKYVSFRNRPDSLGYFGVTGKRKGGLCMQSPPCMEQEKFLAGIRRGREKSRLQVPEDQFSPKKVSAFLYMMFSTTSGRSFSRYMATELSTSTQG